MIKRLTASGGEEREKKTEGDFSGGVTFRVFGNTAALVSKRKNRPWFEKNEKQRQFLEYAF